jgi:hypothetical protein
MTAKGWADLVTKAISDPDMMALLVRLLVEQDEAKHRLREMGFGVTGTPWLQMVDEIEHQLGPDIMRRQAL